MALTLYLILAILSSWIWVDYFKNIGLADTNKKAYRYLMFALGAGAYYLFHIIANRLLGGFEISWQNKILGNLFNSIVKIGLIGEVVKIIPIFIVYYLFKKQLESPIDVFVFFMISVLGYSAIENYYYSLLNEYYFFNDKTVLRTLGEMYCTSIIAYSVIDYRFHSRSKKPLRIVLYTLLAAVLHGFYDFWLYYERLVTLGVIFTILYFCLGISIFANTLTNSINIETDFTYGRVFGNKAKIDKMIKFYFGFVVLQFLVLAFNKQFSFAWDNFLDTLWFSSIIIYFAICRSNNIKVIKRRWNKLRLELPFEFYHNDTFNGRSSKLKFKFKGETFNEDKIEVYYNELCSIYPLSHRNSFIMRNKLIHIEKKFFLKNDETFYLVKLVSDDKNEYMLLKPKTSGKNMVKRKYPIVALFSIHDLEDIKNDKLTAADFQFREWVFIKHR